MIEITTPQGPFKVWTRRVGNNPRIKLLLLHGGPGFPHEYFEAFDDYLLREGIEYIYYALPLVPAIAIAITLLLMRSGLPRFVRWGFLGAYAIGFVAYFPFRQIP